MGSNRTLYLKGTTEATTAAPSKGSHSRPEERRKTTPPPRAATFYRRIFRVKALKNPKTL